jgi:putative DNA primase/helicase
MSETVDRSVGCWVDILSRLGVDQSFLRNKHGPCPLCGGTDRFRFDDKKGSGSWICSQCGSGDGMMLAIKYTGREFKDVAMEIDKMQGVEKKQIKDDRPDPAIRLNKTRAELKPDDGTIANYLSGRGIILPIPKAIKLHTSMAYYEDGELKGRHLVMVATVTAPDGKPNTYHVTYLNKTGKAAVSAPRKILPAKTALPGSAVRLFEPSDYLGLCEGIETALSVTQMTDIPCWACLNATMLEAAEIPETVTRVCVWGDNDENYTGQKSAYILANKLKIKRPELRVHVMIPEQPGYDWNDVLVKIGHTGV